jgi:hypothetical protein
MLSGNALFTTAALAGITHVFQAIQQFIMREFGACFYLISH